MNTDVRQSPLSGPPRYGVYPSRWKPGMVFFIPFSDQKLADRFDVGAEGISYFLGANMVFYVGKNMDPLRISSEVLHKWRDAGNSAPAQTLDLGGSSSSEASPLSAAPACGQEAEMTPTVPSINAALTTANIDAEGHAGGGDALRSAGAELSALNQAESRANETERTTTVPGYAGAIDVEKLISGFVWLKDNNPHYHNVEWREGWAEECLKNAPKECQSCSKEAMDDNAPVATALYCAQYLSEEQVQQHAAFLREEGYKDVGSLRQACTRSSEWHRVKLPLRLKCAVEVLFAGRIFEDRQDRSFVESSVARSPAPEGRPTSAKPTEEVVVGNALSADFATLLDVMKALHREQMELLAQTRHHVHQLKSRLDELTPASSAALPPDAAASSAPVSASSASPVLPLGAASALPAARLARLLLGKAIKELEKEGVDAMKLREANGNLEPPLSAERAAQAYDKAREVRKDCPPKLEEVGKNAALVVREVLVLCICCSAGSLSDVGFESALEQAFGRQLGPELRSQLHLARSAICRIGRDRVLFERQAPKVYGPTVTPEELNQLFPAYADCAVSVGNDRGGSGRPNQPPTSKRRKKPRDREGHRAEAAATDAEMEDEEHVRANTTANNAAESVLREDRLLEPAYVRVTHCQPEWPTSLGAQGLRIPARLLQREWTGGQFIPASEATSQQWYGRCPSCRQDAFNNWNNVCEHCGAGHQQPFQQLARPYAAAARNGPSFQPGKSFTLEAGKGGVVDAEPAERFEVVPLAPIGVTKTSNIKANVEVVERCCLDSLRKTKGKPCLIVMANEGLPLKQNNGSALAVFQGSSLVDIIEAAAGTEPPPLPRCGGYYARSVLVHQLSDSTAVSFESSMVLMRTLWSTPEAEGAETREDGRSRLLNVLRKCRARGHTELVFGAWGSLDNTPLEEISRISELLHDAVLGSSDVAKSFTKVTFAVRLNDDRLQAMREKMQ